MCSKCGFLFSLSLFLLLSVSLSFFGRSFTSILLNCGFVVCLLLQLKYAAFTFRMFYSVIICWPRKTTTKKMKSKKSLRIINNNMWNCRHNDICFFFFCFYSSPYLSLFSICNIVHSKLPATQFPKRTSI